jgi:hypothetical protein
LCKWQKDKQKWDVFETVQIDAPIMVAEFLNNDVDCYKMVLKYEAIIDKVKLCIKHNDTELDWEHATITKKVVEKSKRGFADSVGPDACRNDHDDLFNYKDYDDDKWFATGAKLHNRPCKICNKNLSETKNKKTKPPKVCNKFGATGCCFCICYECSATITLNTDAKRKRRKI